MRSHQPQQKVATRSLSAFRRALWVPRMFLPYKVRELLLGRTFQRKMGYRMDFRNPRTFNEKIQWCKLYYHHLDATRIADKVAFKSYVAERLGEGNTAKLYGAWDNVDDIDFHSIPLPYVLKSNCCGFGDCVRFVFGHEDLDPERLRCELRPWLDPMNTLIPQSARGYFHIMEPLIMAEEFVGSGQTPPVDYKFFCFGGVPRYAYSASEHFQDGRAVSSEISFYDMDWNPLDVRYGTSKRHDLPKPTRFDEMRQVAELLSRGFPFMRVDFYDCGSTWLVSEMTFSSGAGFQKFEPQSFDLALGDLFELPPKNTDQERFRGDLLAAYLRHVAVALRDLIVGSEKDGCT